MHVEPRQLAVALAGFNALDAIACAAPLPFIKADLDRLGCSDELQHALPFIKAMAAAGLLVGLKVHKIGLATSTALVAYYACAVGFHVRAGDHPVRWGPAVALGGFAACTARVSYRPVPVSAKRRLARSLTRSRQDAP